RSGRRAAAPHGTSRARDGCSWTPSWLRCSGEHAVAHRSTRRARRGGYDRARPGVSWCRTMATEAAMNGNGLQSFLQYLGARFRRKLTRVPALIVGTLINLYGQLLVPWLRDIDEPTNVFVRHLEDHPSEGIL